VYNSTVSTTFSALTLSVGRDNVPPAWSIRGNPMSPFQPLAFMYHPVFDGRGFSRLSNSWRRYALARQQLQESDLLSFEGADATETANQWYPLREHVVAEATDEEILLAHTPEHLKMVREADARGTGFLDYGDTPAWPGVLRRSRLAVGGTLAATRLVASGSIARAFNPAGGLHHARADRAGGFCPLNDLVIAVRCLQREFGYERIAIVDLDGHHGDGTEAMLYDEPILTVSMHRYGGRFYPGTGAASDVGRGRGFGHNLNVPLERGTDAATYLQAFEQWVAPALLEYRPQLVFYQVGADSHAADPLVRLGLTLSAFRQLATRLRDLADELCDGKLVAVAGGGYAPEHVARCWTVVLAALTGVWTDDDPRYLQLVIQDLPDSEGLQR
jgi:acetoin utilization protein AcuC